MYSGVFIVNFEHISYLARPKHTEIRALYWKKRKKSKFNRFQIEVFFLPSINPFQHHPPPHLSYISPPKYRPIKLSFVLIYARGVLTVCNFFANALRVAMLTYLIRLIKPNQRTKIRL